jgi:DNA-binding MarR family transcriptional regulator
MTPALNPAGAAGLMFGTARRGALRRAALRPPPDAETDAVSPERALDELLATLERGELSPTEIRVLLWLAEREATAAELTDALQHQPGAITTVAYRLAMRGLIRRWFEGGQRARSVFAITSAGMLALRPLLQWVSEAGPGASVPPAAAPRPVVTRGRPCLQQGGAVRASGKARRAAV